MSKLVLGDVALHYQCLGEGEDVVLIHGLGANLAFWYMGIAKLLARRYRVISYDLRGHGRSSMPSSGYSLPYMAQDLHALLDHLCVRRAHLVGHSFGARIALYYTISYMARVTSLTVADTQIQSLQPQIRLRDWPYWQIWKRELQQQGYQALPSDSELINFRLLAHFNQLSGDFSRKALGRPNPGLSLKTRDMGQRGSARWEQLLKLTSAQQEFDDDHQLTRETLQQIVVPTLAMYGEYSHCLDSCWQMQHLIPDCQAIIVPNAGHFHPAIRPRVFTHWLFRWLFSMSAAPLERRGRRLGKMETESVDKLI